MGLDYKNELNESQLLAVEYCDGPSLVIAGAGSGKTRVLTYKIAYLLEHGFEPWNILALTFTNKAAAEMRSRIGKLVGEDKARYLWMGTFHSIFARILRTECQYIDYSSDYTIYDAQDSQALIKQIIKEEGLDDKKYKPSIIAGRISEAKNNLVSPSTYAMSGDVMSRDKASNIGMTYKIYELYQQRLFQSQAMDFDDLLVKTYELFDKNPEVKQRYEDKFKFVLVDEYQDTNRVQHQIIQQITKNSQMVCVVGDDAQSIYSFRGAKIDNILYFQRQYANTKLFKLEQNYRSTQTIVGAANSLIHKNKRQIFKNVFSKKDVGEPIEVCDTYSAQEESCLVARRIGELRRKGHEWKDFAILYRTNSQSRLFEEEFRKNTYPYRIIGGLSFYQRKEVKDTVAYLRLAVNPYDEGALRRVINYPARGIGNTTIDKVSKLAIVKGLTMWDVISNPDATGLDVNKGTASKLTAFAQFIQECHEMSETEDAGKVANKLIQESGLKADVFLGREPEDISRQENLQELYNGILSFVSDAQEQGESILLSNYLQGISLLSDNEEAGADDDNRITLMTVHSAKGLEFPIVFVVGLEEELFPSERATECNDVEEERRLFYVAMTRAEQCLFLTWSRSRMIFGKWQNQQKSRFLTEIDSQFLKDRTKKAAFGSPFGSRPTSPERPFGTTTSRSNTSPWGTSQPTPKPTEHRSMRPVRSLTSSFTAATPLPDDKNVKVGDKVAHERFGVGIVEAITDTGLNAKATINFENEGRKQLLLRFAKIKIVD